MSVKEITQKESWKPKKEFLQSWEYGDFLILTGRNVVRLEIDNENNFEQIQCTINNIPLNGSFVYIPRAQISKSILEVLLKYFKESGHTFVRLELTNEIGDLQYTKKLTKNRQPHDTWILDISKDIDFVLKKMHEKTRYNIRLAQKKEVHIDHKKDLEIFWNLNIITTQRNNYKSHPKKYIENLLKLDNVYQLNAYFKDVSLASAIILKYNTTLIYFFGASSNEYRNVMAPYLLHLEIIKLAKELGCTTYDFWGIAPPAKEGSGVETCYHAYCWDSSHPLNGVSRFKAGFGGFVQSYPDAYEIVLNPVKYFLFSTIQKIRRQGIVGHPLST